LADEIDLFGGASPVVEVRSQDSKRASANCVAGIADDVGLFCREVGNLATVLKVLGVSKGEGSNDLVLLGLWEILNGSVRECSTLAVTADDKLRVGTLGIGFGDERLHLLDAPEVCTAGEKVGGKTGVVLDTLYGDLVGAKVLLETLTGRWATDGAHVANLGRAPGEEHDDWPAATLGELVGGNADPVLSGLEGSCTGQQWEKGGGVESHVEKEAWDKREKRSERSVVCCE
jgi:hypothetical protein